MLRGDAAGAYRDAAEWSLLLAAQQARGYFDAAARLYLENDEPYGLAMAILGTGEVDWQRAMEPYVQALAQPPSGAPADGSSPGTRFQLPYPQQWLYVITAMVADAIRRGAEPASIAASFEGSGLENVNEPIGKLGIPVRDFWMVLLAIAQGDHAEAARGISSIYRAFSYRIRWAAVNEYVWTNAASPVTPANAEIVLLEKLAERRFGSDFAGTFESAVRSQAERSISTEAGAVRGLRWAADVQDDGPRTDMHVENALLRVSQSADISF